MCHRRLVLLLVLLLPINGCGPFTAVGMVGSSVVKTIENKHKREAIEEPVRLEIAQTNVNVAAEYIRQGDFERALVKLQRAEQAKPDYAPAYNALGILYQAKGQPEDAEENFLKALKLDAGNPNTMNNYGQFLCRQGRVDEAETLFNKAAEDPLYRTPEVSLTNAGLCALLYDNETLAISYFNRALSLNPRISPALLSMAEIEFKKGNYFTSNTYLKRYLETAPHTPRTLWLGIRLQRILGDKDLLASYSLLLRNKYPQSPQARLLKDTIRHSSNLVAATGKKTMYHPHLIHDFGFINEAVLLTETDLLSESRN